MSDPFVAEIRIFGFNFAPRNWAQCNGQVLPIAQNTALFSLLGTTYGGNGQSTFALPNLQGSAACSSGQGAGGLTFRSLGETFGSPTATVSVQQLPSHSHAFNGRNPTSGQTVDAPTAGCHLARTIGQADFTNTATPTTILAPQSIGASAGGGQPHPNQQPYLAINFCIALTGIFPPRP